MLRENHPAVWFFEQMLLEKAKYASGGMGSGGMEMGGSASGATGGMSSSGPRSDKDDDEEEKRKKEERKRSKSNTGTKRTGDRGSSAQSAASGMRRQLQRRDARIYDYADDSEGVYDEELDSDAADTEFGDDEVFLSKVFRMVTTGGLSLALMGCSGPHQI